MNIFKLLFGNKTEKSNDIVLATLLRRLKMDTISTSHLRLLNQEITEEIRRRVR